MKIKDLKVGANCTITLVVSSATARETKAKKPYLALEFFDGTDKISGNYWDWSSGNVPEANTIVDVAAQVTEWNGTKQLNVKAMKVNTTRELHEFAPSSGHDIGEVYKHAYALMEEVKDDTLRTIALGILEELRSKWLTIPGAVGVHHNYVGGTLVHSYDVAVKAKAMAQVTAGANVDLATVGAMLHDVGKLYTYKLNGVNIEHTDKGRMFEHLFMGAEFIGNFADTHVDTDDSKVAAKVELLRHIILSHHGQLEYGSPVTPQFIEAYIVHFADNLDATNEQLRKASANVAEDALWTERIYTLNNRPHVTHSQIAKIMN